jgi:hypothetical protein
MDNFYKQQCVLTTAIRQLSHTNLAFHKSTITQPACVAPNESLDHGMNGSLCVVTMINTSTNNVTGYDMCEYQTQNMKGNTDRVPWTMSMEGIERITCCWKNTHRGKYFGHDNDSRTKKKIKEVGLNIDDFVKAPFLRRSAAKGRNEISYRRDPHFQWSLCLNTEYLGYPAICVMKCPHIFRTSSSFPIMLHRLNDPSCVFVQPRSHEMRDQIPLLVTR